MTGLDGWDVPGHYCPTCDVYDARRHHHVLRDFGFSCAGTLALALLVAGVTILTLYVTGQLP